jgi:hypothetical protein
MYTHMSNAVSTAVGRHFARGEVLGGVGDRGAPGTPHLHFTAFTAEGAWASNRRSIPLSFAEGVNLPDVGGCSQHQGEQLTAAGPLADAAGLAFRSNGEPNRWYNQDLAIEFGGTAAAQGYSAAWEADPGGDAPRVAEARSGQAKLSEAGEGLHRLYVRAWDAQGNQTTAVYGPIGLDVTPPEARPMAQPATVAAGQPSAIEWPAALDNGSGVAGYRVYVGGDPNGASEWYVTTPHADLPALEPGDYVVRVQPIDYAGNSAGWATIGALAVR